MESQLTPQMRARTEREMIAQLYQRFAGRVYARCLYLLRDKEAAKDAMHDVFIKAQKNLGDFRQEASPLTWMTRIATNHCLNIIRAKRAAWHERYRKEVELSERGDSHAATFKENQQLLRLVLVQVDPALAEMATLYFVDEMSQAEVCQAVGVSAPTLRKRLREFIEVARVEIAKAIPGVTFQDSPI